MKKITVELIDGTKLEFSVLENATTEFGCAMETETEEIFIPMRQIKIIRGKKNQSKIDLMRTREN